MEIALVILIMVAAVVLFATERFSVDVVAIMILGALLVLKLVTPEEGLSGFSNPATVTVAAMFVLSAGLQKTGSLALFGRLLTRWGSNQFLLLMLIMLPIGVVSGFINNTAAVAVFLPLVLTTAAARKVSASKLLIPLSFASQFGGVCTLIGTSTNLLVSSISQQSGYGAWSLFEFSRLGIIMFGAGVVYFLVVGQWILPARRREELTEEYQLSEYITELQVMEGSKLIGKTVLESDLRREFKISVLELLRGGNKLWSPTREPIQEGDILLVEASMKQIMEVKGELGLEIAAEFKLKDELMKSKDLKLVEALVAPRSRFIGHTLRSLDFHRSYNAIVLSLRRRAKTIHEKLNSTRLQFGDAMVLLGPKEKMDKLRSDKNLLFLGEIEEPSLRRERVPMALGIMLLVIGLAALNVFPILVSAILGCLAMVLTRCMTLEQAYEAIDWKVILLLAGILPLGIALQKSGAAEFVSNNLFGYLGKHGPVVMLAAVYLVTAVLTECMSNNAAAVLLAPIAISGAVKLGVDPKPFLMAVTFAASTSFATPVGFLANTMLYSAGGYKFTDFLKVGVPLNLLFWGLAVYFIPKIWPFYP